MTKTKNTMLGLLEAIFEGHEIRYGTDSAGRTLFVAKDVCAALGISKHRDAMADIDAAEIGRLGLDLPLSPGQRQMGPERSSSTGHQIGSLDRDLPSTSTGRQMDATGPDLTSTSTGHQVGRFSGRKHMVAVTESGLVELVARSRKEPALRFRRWLFREVLPQIHRYGSYVQGATVAERIRMAHRRIRAERAGEIAASAAAMQTYGLTDIGAFVRLRGVAPRDVLGFANMVKAMARRFGWHAPKFFLGRRMVPAYPAPVLEAALLRYQPALPFQAEGGAAR